MNVSEILIIIGGILSLLMGLFHTQFPKIFKLKNSFKEDQNSSYKIIFTIHIALIIILFEFGFFSIIYSQEIAQKKGLGFGFLIINSILWLWRLFWQIYYFKIPKNLDKKPVLHYFLISFFSIMLSIYLIPLFL